MPALYIFSTAFMDNLITDNIVNDDYIMDQYTTMKQKYGNEIILLFHVGSFFESYLADSVVVAEILKLPRVLLEKHLEYVIYAVRFSENELDENVKQLYSADYGIVIIDMVQKDDKPNFDKNE